MVRFWWRSTFLAIRFVVRKEIWVSATFSLDCIAFVRGRLLSGEMPFFGPEFGQGSDLPYLVLWSIPSFAMPRLNRIKAIGSACPVIFMFCAQMMALGRTQHGRSKYRQQSLWDLWSDRGKRVQCADKQVNMKYEHRPLFCF